MKYLYNSTQEQIKRQLEGNKREIEDIIERLKKLPTLKGKQQAISSLKEAAKDLEDQIKVGVY